MADEFAKTIVACALPTSTLPLVRRGEFPERVNVFGPTVKVPEVRVNVPFNDTSPARINPLDRFNVRCCRVIDDNVVEEPLPPKTRFEVLPPVKIPDTFVIAPLKVSVFAPIEKLPFVSDNV